MVGLLCTERKDQQDPIKDVQLTNAANAYQELLDMIPVKVLQHLQTPIVHALQDDGQDASISHILQNVYPIFSSFTAQTPLTCRFTRDAIETGYQRIGLDMPDKLVKALDAFQDCLNQGPHLSLKLEPGHMLFWNNHTLLHTSHNASLIKSWLSFS